MRGCAGTQSTRPATSNVGSSWQAEAAAAAGVAAEVCVCCDCVSTLCALCIDGCVDYSYKHGVASPYCVSLTNNLSRCVCLLFQVVLGASVVWTPAFSVPDARGVSKPAGE